MKIVYNPLSENFDFVRSDAELDACYIRRDGSTPITANWNVDGAGTLFVDKTNKLVGIGTTNPNTKLQILNATGNATVSVNGTDIYHTYSTESRYRLSSNGTVNFSLPTGYDGGALGLFSSNNGAVISGGGSGVAKLNMFVGSFTDPKFTILHSGNIGITTVFPAGAPVEKLTVAGGNAIIYNSASLGSEKVVNGAFADSSSWTWGTGWAHDATNLEADHTAGNTAALEQNVSAVTGEIYQVVFTVKNRTTGSITPQVGGVNGAAVSANTTSTQQIRATGTGNLKFTPSSDFNGSLDDISVKLIIGGDLKLAGLLTGGGSSGIKVMAGGNVGIGTTAPGSKLEIRGENTLGVIDAKIVNTATTGNYPSATLYLQAYNGTSVTNGGALFHTGNSFVYGQILANQTNLYGYRQNGLRLSVSNSAPITFATAGSDPDLSTEKMRLTSAGYLGIGETAPDYKLDVNGTIGFTPGSSVTPVDNGDVVVEATNNTTLTFKLKGSDGTIRSGTLTLS